MGLSNIETTDTKKYCDIWEIFVPTQWHEADVFGNINWDSELKPIRTRHHKRWDEKVIEITGGLTIVGKVSGKWVSNEGTQYDEPMIACRIMCTEEQILKIADFTVQHYRQKAVLCYRLSTSAIIVNRK